MSFGFSFCWPSFSVRIGKNCVLKEFIFLSVTDYIAVPILLGMRVLLTMEAS